MTKGNLADILFNFLHHAFLKFCKLKLGKVRIFDKYVPHYFDENNKNLQNILWAKFGKFASVFGKNIPLDVYKNFVFRRNAEYLLS